LKILLPGAFVPATAMILAFIIPNLNPVSTVNLSTTDYNNTDFLKKKAIVQPPGHEATKII